MNGRNNLPPKPELKPKPGSVRVVRALQKYSGIYPDELSFEEGDILYLFEKADSAWRKACCGSKTGIIPESYVEGKVLELVEPLHDAARRGNLLFLQECLNQKVSSTRLDKIGNTPLYWASNSGHIDCIKCLLKEPNPPLNVKNHFGDTPLHCATARNHFEAVKLLLNSGADSSIANINGETPLMLAMSPPIKNLLQKQMLNSATLQTLPPEEYEDDSD